MHGMPKVQLSCIKTEKVDHMEHIFLYFATDCPKRCFYWGVPKVPKKIGDGPINMAPSKKKKNSEPTHEVINMNHTMSPKNSAPAISLGEKW
jgi:hypothetical protein